jgi:hypothetical protein
VDSGEQPMTTRLVPNRNPIRLTQVRVRVTARSRQINHHRWEAESGQIATEIAAPTSKTNIIMQRSRYEMNEMRMEARSEVSGLESGCGTDEESNWLFARKQEAILVRFHSLSQLIVGEEEAMSRVRSAAQKPRALDIASSSPKIYREESEGNKCDRHNQIYC